MRVGGWLGGETSTTYSFHQLLGSLVRWLGSEEVQEDPYPRGIYFFKYNATEIVTLIYLRPMQYIV